MKIVGITGNSTRPSKTRALAEHIVRTAARHCDDGTNYDLLDVHPVLGATIWPNDAAPEVKKLLDDIVTCDLLVVGSPVYKSSLTGMLKHLFDLIDMKALKDRPVILFATGKAPGHGPQVEDHMRALFAFFGAHVVGNFIYALDDDFQDGNIGPALMLKANREIGTALKMMGAHQS